MPAVLRRSEECEQEVQAHRALRLAVLWSPSLARRSTRGDEAVEKAVRSMAYGGSMDRKTGERGDFLCSGREARPKMLS
jgi:hypothetical protein